MESEIRTDLALEEKERFEGTQAEVKGVLLEEKNSPAGIFQITIVKILNEDGAKAMRKPIGNYVTLENCSIEDYDEILCDEMTQEIKEYLKEMIGGLKKEGRIKNNKIIVAGLGNREATPDALGPQAAEQILVGTDIYALAPGVMAQTGFETSDYIKGIAKEVNAGLIIAIDSLAARNTRRLNTTVQITDTGINPGSGVGNHRHALNEETMGIPVIAIGVPTVVDAATIVNDVFHNMVEVLQLTDIMEHFSEDEKRQLVKELMGSRERDLYVTPKDIDETIVILGRIIADGINGAVHNF